MSILKVDTKVLPLYSLNFYSLVYKIEIRLKYFLDKKPQKQQQWLCKLVFELVIAEVSKNEKPFKARCT